MKTLYRIEYGPLFLMQDGGFSVLRHTSAGIKYFDKRKDALEAAKNIHKKFGYDEDKIKITQNEYTN